MKTQHTFIIYLFLFYFIFIYPRTETQDINPYTHDIYHPWCVGENTTKMTSWLHENMSAIIRPQTTACGQGVRQGSMDISQYVNTLQLLVNHNALCLPGSQLEGRGGSGPRHPLTASESNECSQACAVEQGSNVAHVPQLMSKKCKNSLGEEIYSWVVLVLVGGGWCICQYFCCKPISRLVYQENLKICLDQWATLKC